MKKMFDFNTKTIVATGIGAALFTLLYTYVAIPTGIPNTSIMPAFGISAFFGALYGPIAAGLICFIGSSISAAMSGGIWWSWAIAAGVCGFIGGMCYPKLKIEEGIFEKKDIIVFNVWALIGNAIAWVLVAPILDIVIYAEPVELVFTQGAVAGLTDEIAAAVIGTVLLMIYAKTRAQKGSLSKG